MAEDTITPSSSQQAVIALNKIYGAIAIDPIDPTRIPDNSITNAKLSTMAQSTVKGRAAGAGAGDVTDLTSAQATAVMDVMVADSGSGGTKGLAGAPAAGDAAAHKFWGAGATWATALVRDTSQVTITGSSFDFTGIPAWARKITCMFTSLSLSGSDHLLIQIGDSGGLETTGYVSTAVATSSDPATLSTSSTSGYVAYLGSASNVIQGMIVLNNITGNLWIASGAYNYTNYAAYVAVSSGTKTTSATLDRVRFTVTGANTFNSGVINIMYE